MQVAAQLTNTEATIVVAAVQRCVVLVRVHVRCQIIVVAVHIGSVCVLVSLQRAAAGCLRFVFLWIQTAATHSLTQTHSLIPRHFRRYHVIFLFTRSTFSIVVL